MRVKDEIQSEAVICRSEISKFEFEKSESVSNIKNLKKQLEGLYIEETVTDLLKLQEQEGSLDVTALNIFLRDLVSKVKD